MFHQKRKKNLPAAVSPLNTMQRINDKIENIKKMEETLRSIYYNTKHPAGFSSVAKLAKASNYSQAKVKKWLKAQPTYTLHHQARKKYLTRKYIVHDIDEQWQADLADVSLIASQNNGYRYILTVIDIFRAMLGSGH